MKSSIFNFKPTLLSVLIGSAIVAGCTPSETAFQEQEARNQSVFVKHDQNSNAALQDIDALEEIVVTGSRYRSAEMQSSRMNNSVSYIEEQQNEQYADLIDSSVIRVASEPVSTFSIDVDTGAYSNVRRFLNNGSLPPTDAIRSEELINYFSYDYPAQAHSNVPFSINTEVSLSPWNENKHLMHIGLQVQDLDQGQDLSSNLVFLLDVSGSMNSPDKLGLLQTSLKMLSRQLDENDSVSIVVYAGASGVVLEPTAGNEHRQIAAALDRLSAGGGTNGEAGIQLAYSLAKDAFIEGGINRVILATDGDFNVGTSNVEALKELISKKRQSGISLTTLGFGAGNYNDQLMEQLADEGNGNYAYIDNVNEARKVLVDEMSSTLQTVAKDVKIQIEFNPALVSEYRLIGYENRALQREDFNNDNVDAGEIGAGHTVTAIYEVSLVGSDAQSVDSLRYTNERPAASQNDHFSNELAFLKLRYKEPEANRSQLVEQSINLGDIENDINQTSENFRFSAAVAGFAQLLRNNQNNYDLSYEQVLTLANEAKGEDEFGYRMEFINLARTAQALTINETDYYSVR